MILREQIHIDTLEPIAMLNSMVLKAAVAEGVLRINSGHFDANADSLRIKAIHRIADLTSVLSHPTCCSIGDANSLASYHACVVGFLQARTANGLAGVLEMMNRAEKFDTNNAEAWGSFHDRFKHDLPIIRHYAKDKKVMNAQSFTVETSN
jgi:hypothetical protein